MERSIITDKLVVAQTGKTLEDWYSLLDSKGAKDLKHAAIFELVQSIKGLQPLGQWNQNLLATSYEWSRGLKERGAREDGIEISISRTLPVPVALLYQSWADEALRERWLPGQKITIRKATKNKSLRITWSDEQTHVSVELYVKDKDKTQVVVQHMKIAGSEAAASLKAYWSVRLEALKSLIA